MRLHHFDDQINTPSHYVKFYARALRPIHTQHKHWRHYCFNSYSPLFYFPTLERGESSPKSKNSSRNHYWSLSLWVQQESHHYFWKKLVPFLCDWCQISLFIQNLTGWDWEVLVIILMKMWGSDGHHYKV